MTPVKTPSPNKATSDVWADTSWHISSWNVGFYCLGGEECVPEVPGLGLQGWWAVRTLCLPPPPQPHKTPASPDRGPRPCAGDFNRQTGYRLTP